MSLGDTTTLLSTDVVDLVSRAAAIVASVALLDLETLLEPGLVEPNPHRLLVTTRGFLEFAGLGDLAHLPALGAPGAAE